MHRAWTLVLSALMLSGALAALAPDAEAASSTTTTSTLLQPTVGSSAAHVNGATYLFGGRTVDTSTNPPGMRYLSDIVRFDHATGVAQRVDSFPPTANSANPGRYSGAAIAAGGKVYYFGGATLVEADVNADGNPDQVPKASKDIFVFDPATNKVSVALDTLPLPAWGLSGTTAVVQGRTIIYLFGGFTFDLTNLGATQRHEWILRYDLSKPDGQRVSRVSDVLPYSVQDAAVANLNGRIFVMGGLSDHDANANPCPTYQTYNPETQTQETKQTQVCLTRKIVSFDPVTDLVRGVMAAELPYRAQFVSAAVLDSKAYIPGALLPDGTASSSIVEITQANGVPAVKTITPTLPQGTFGQGVTTDGTSIWVFGGRWGDDTDLTSAIVRIDPRPTVPWAPRSAQSTLIQGGVRLTWEPPAYNGDSIVTSYRVYRTPAGGAETLLQETTSLTYDDTTVRPGVEYSYRITALNVVGESATSARVGGSAEATVPGPVGAFQAYGGNGEVILRWRAPAETGGSNLSGYRVFRDGALRQTLPPSATEFRDADVENGRAYAYQVKAYNAKGDGDASETLRVSPAPVPAPPVSVFFQRAEDASSVTLSWIPPNENVDHFLVLRTAPDGATITVGNVTETTFTDTQVEKGRTYVYSVVSANSVGTSPPSQEVAVSLVRKPGPPTQVTALGLEGEIRISWLAPEDRGDADPASLRYYVTRSGGGSSRTIGIKTDIEGLTYTDRTATPGQAYTYTVSTLNPQQSDPSAPATATAKQIQNKPPVAILAILPSVTTAGDPVELDASQSADLDGTVRSYVFDFGDGTDPVSTTTPTVTHAYERNGTFTATVVVTDNRGDASLPASSQVVVGEIASNDKVESGFPGTANGATRTTDNRPGTETPEVPGPGALVALVALVGVALVVRRLR